MAALSNETIEIIKATAGVVGQHALEITKTFYPLMFKNNPEVLQFFNKSNQAGGTQPEALANAVVAYASNIDRLGNLTQAVDIIAHKHCGLEVLPEHYAIVEKNLLLAIGQVLGGVLTPTITQAWVDAVHALSSVLINREEQLYAEAAARAGGFRTWKDFRIVEKRTIADRTTYLKFKPVLSFGQAPQPEPEAQAQAEAQEEAERFDFTAGQFITLLFPNGSTPAKRHYTVVSAPGADHLAIAVRRVPPRSESVPAGLVSNAIADCFEEGQVVKLMPPFGGFTLKASELVAQQKQVLLLSAGIGITPIQAFLRELHYHQQQQQQQQQEVVAGSDNNNNNNNNNKIVSVHQDHQPSSHAFADCHQLAHHAFIRYTTEDTEHFVKGRLDEHDLRHVFDVARLDPQQTVVFCCGPPSFMADCSRYVKALGVDTFHAEFFGPQLSTKLAL